MIPKNIKADIKMRLKPIMYENPSYEDTIIYQAGFKAGYRAAMTHKTNSLIRIYQTKSENIKHVDVKDEIDFIIDSVISIMQVSEKELYSDCRFRKLAISRSIIMNLLRDITALSYPKIGEVMGGKDHSTVIHHVRLKRDRHRFWIDNSEAWEVYNKVYNDFVEKFQDKNSLK